MLLGNKAINRLLKSLLALASLVSVVISSRLALKDIGDLQYNSAHKGSGNFHEFLNSARCLLEGYNIYDPSVFQNIDLVRAYLPNSFVFFFPLVPLGFYWAKIFWLVLNLFFTVLLARQISVLFWEKKHFFILTALITCAAPWGILIYAGQVTLWSLCFFLLALQWDRENRPILSGLAITICLLKYVLTAPMLLYFLVYRRSWKNLAVAAGIQAILFCFFCFYLKLTPWDLFWGPIRVAKALDIGHNGYLDLFAFFSRFANHAVGDLYLPTALLMAGIWIWFLYRQKDRDDLSMLTLTVMTVLTIVYHNIYDYVGGIFPLVWCLKRLPCKDGNVLAIGGAAIAVLYVSAHYFEFFPHMQWLLDFMKSNVYLIFLSLLWYLSLALLWLHLKSAGKEPTSLPAKRG